MAEQTTTSRISDIGAQAPNDALDSAKERLGAVQSAAQRGAGAFIEGWADLVQVFVPPVLARRGALLDVTFDLAQSSLNVSRSAFERLVDVTDTSLASSATSNGRARRKS
jgi:hypothetical protein